MKVGDLVRKTYWKDDIGIVIEKCPNPTKGGLWSCVLFEHGFMYEREAELEVISASR